MLPRPADFRQAGNPGGAEIDDLHRTGGVDHDVVRTQILVEHLQAVKGTQPQGDLLDDAAHRFQVGIGVIDHPLPQSLPVDELAGGIEIVAPARGHPGLQDVGAVDAPGDPLLGQQALQVGDVVAQVDGRRLEDDWRLAGLIHGQVDVAAAAGVHFPDDPVAIEAHPRIQQRRQRQFAQLLLQFVGVLAGQAVDPDDLHGEVVRAALGVGFLGDELRRGIEVVGMGIDRGDDERVAGMFVDAIGGEEKRVAAFQRKRPVIDFQMWIDAQGAAQVALLRGDPHPVIVGQLFEGVVAQAIDPCVADMEDMRGGGLDDHGAQRAHIASVPVVAVLALPGLRMQPGVGRHQYALCRLLDRPGFRGTEIVLEESLDAGFAGDLADIAAADAVGQGDGDALGMQLGRRGNVQAVEILIDVLAALVGVLADGDLQSSGHGGHEPLAGRGSCGSVSAGRAWARS
ncbi:hypothetical protein D3C78_661580 [compost metagenome]